MARAVDSGQQGDDSPNQHAVFEHLDHRTIIEDRSRGETPRAPVIRDATGDLLVRPEGAKLEMAKVFDRTCNDERRCYVNSGIEPALRGMKNVEVKHIEDERFKKVALNGKALKEWDLYGEALSADVFINVPVLKHHGLSKLTLGLKNIMASCPRPFGTSM